MKKSQSPLSAGMILCAVGIYLIIYFSVNAMWNAGTVFALVIIAAVAGFQFFVYFKLLKVDDPVKKAKNKNRRKN